MSARAFAHEVTHDLNPWEVFVVSASIVPATRTGTAQYIGFTVHAVPISAVSVQQPPRASQVIAHVAKESRDDTLLRAVRRSMVSQQAPHDSGKHSTEQKTWHRVHTVTGFMFFLWYLFRA